MKSMATLIFEMLQRFANCTGFVRNLSHVSPSSADTATQSQNCQLDTKRFPGMRKVCERYAKGMRKVWPPRPPAGRAAPSSPSPWLLSKSNEKAYDFMVLGPQQQKLPSPLQIRRKTKHIQNKSSFCGLGPGTQTEA